MSKWYEMKAKLQKYEAKMQKYLNGKYECQVNWYQNAEGKDYAFWYIKLVTVQADLLLGKGLQFKPNYKPTNIQLKKFIKKFDKFVQQEVLKKCSTLL